MFSYTDDMKVTNKDVQKIQKTLKKMYCDFKEGKHNTSFFLGVMALLLIFTGVRLVQVSGDNKNLAQEQDRLTQEVTRLASAQGTVADQLALMVSASQSDFETLREETEERLLEARSEIENARLNLEDKIASQSSQLRSVIRTWAPRIPRVECTFAQQDNNGLTSFSSSGGAGTFFTLDDQNYILTNEHVLKEEGEVLQTCTVVFTDTDQDYVFDMSAIDTNFDQGLDVGRVKVVAPPKHILDRMALETDMCQERPVIGDQIVILGYPSIGAEGSITATEGIISGFEDEYFITSAKVEKGNSGGAAILIRENCYLGIPTFTAAGRAESLARILDVRSI